MGNVSWVIATKPKPIIFCALISNALAILKKKIIFEKMKTKQGVRRVSKRKREKKGQKERKRKSEKKIDSERNSYRYIDRKIIYLVNFISG